MNNVTAHFLNRSRLAWLGVAFVCLNLPAFTASAQVSSHGTDILHYSVLKRMVNQTPVAATGGRVEVLHNAQGGSERQQLDIFVRGLSRRASYQLVYALEFDTEGRPVWQVLVDSFTPNGLGRATYLYRRVNPGTLNRGRIPLPDTLAPVEKVKAVGVYKFNTVDGALVANELVMWADLTAPDRLGYFVKRDLSTDAVKAYLRIHGTRQQVQFRLVAYNLPPATDYHLFLNGVDVKTGTTGPRGGLVIQSPLQQPLDVLALKTVELKDTADPANVILSTTLP